MPPRPSKPETTSADEAAVSAGSFAPPADRFYDLSIKVGGIEQSITYLEGRASDAATKMDALGTKIDLLAKEITEAKTMLGTIKPIVKNIGRAIWTAVGGITVFLLGLLTLWIKHHFGW